VRELSGETEISGDGLMLAAKPDSRPAART
jgi:hypothetical protein